MTPSSPQSVRGSAMLHRLRVKQRKGIGTECYDGKAKRRGAQARADSMTFDSDRTLGKETRLPLLTTIPVFLKIMINVLSKDTFFELSTGS
jgi:hypothetical protein